MKAKNYYRNYLLICVLNLFVAITVNAQVKMKFLGRYSTNVYNNGSAEISAYDPISKYLFVTSGTDTSIKVVSLANPSTPVEVNSISLKPYGIDVTSVACKNGVFAAAVIDSFGKTNASNIVFFNAQGAFLNKVKAGPNADMVVFTPDGKKVLVANEGEPNSDYTIDPEGSISIIDISNGVNNLTQSNVTHATFTQFNNQILDPKIRIFGKIQSGGNFLRNSTVAEDLEPEYIAISNDSKTAWVTCQENNCLAVVNIETATVTSLIPLGYKNHNLPINSLDASDQGSSINITTWPVFGMYNPDAIAYYSIGSNQYVITANEGDARADWGAANNEEIRFGSSSYVLDTAKFGGASNIAALKANTALGRLTVSKNYGDFNNDGKIDSAFCFGARSFSIWNATTGALVWDSKNEFEQYFAQNYPLYFNSSHTTNALKNRSDDKGPEPEAITIGKILDSTYAFVGLERIGGIMVYNITNPNAPYFSDYINTRNFNVTPSQANLSAVGDLGPEGLIFIPKSQSPNGKDLLVVSHEISGTVTIIEVQSRSSFQLQILHASDMESGLDAVIDAPNFAAVLDKLEDENTNTIRLASGDCYIPGPFLSAGEDPSLQTPLRNTASSYFSGSISGLRAAIGRTDIAMMNILGFQGSALGNHEFDLGTSEVNGIIGVDIRNNGADKRWIGAQFPYLSANLNFNNDANLSYLYTNKRLLVDSFKTSPNITENSQKKGIAPSAVIIVNGEKIGLVGATTQLLAKISSPGLTTILGSGQDNMAELAATLQPVIDSLRFIEGINKIIVMSHLQQLANEEALAPLLNGVDIIIAGGSHALCADSNDRIRPGNTVFRTYPIMTLNKDNDPLAILNTTSEWKYLGRFVCEFDTLGKIIPASLNSQINGAYAADSAMVTQLWGNYNAAFAPGTKGANVRILTTAIANVINTKDGNKFGKSNVFLEGRRNFVRTEETNLGNITSDANLWYARWYDPSVRVSIKNGGGIRSAIGFVNAVGSNAILDKTLPNASANKLAGDISQLDIENSLRFNNGLVIATTNAAGLKRILEHAVSASNPNATPGQFPQVGGVNFSYDTTKMAGNRIQSLVVLDSLGRKLDTLVRNGLLYGDTTRNFKFVTLDFLYNGGDNYPFIANSNSRVNLDTAIKNIGVATFTTTGKEQDAFAEFMASKYSVNPFNIRDTNLIGDNRIQLLNTRMEGVIVPNSGPSSSQDPYVKPALNGVTTTAILTVGDAVNNYKMVGIPDGTGAFDNGNGTFTLLMNHELGSTAGIVRAHGEKGAFISKWTINKNTLEVLNGSDLINNVYLYTPGIGYTLYTPGAPNPKKAFNRFCSADLPPVSAFYNNATGNGVQDRIYLTGEEAGAEGRLFAHLVTGVNAGTSYELPALGKFSWENALANPSTGDKTVVAGTDDTTPGQIYLYIGNKTNTGNEIEKAGLTNGRLYGVAVNGLATEISGSFPAPNTPFSLVDLGFVKDSTGAGINNRSNALNITNFLRPEDAAWDPNNPRDLYFVTTNSLSSPSRLYRLRFNNLNDFTQGGTITALLDGTEGQKMMDNITIDKFGNIIIQEDVGNNAHLGKIWNYNIESDQLTLLATHDSLRFINGAKYYLTQDEEASGVIDMEEILGRGNFLIVDQAHYSIPGELVEGGQLLKMFSPITANSNYVVSAIADARIKMPNDTVRVRGIVTRAWGRFIYIQDQTGAIGIRQSSGDMVNAISNGLLKEGDSVEVIGARNDFFNYAQIQLSSGAYNNSNRVTVLGSNKIVQPITVTVKELNTNGEFYESKLVKVVGLNTNVTGNFAASTNYTVWDGNAPGDTITMRAISSADTEIDDAPVTIIPTDGFSFEGILAQFCSNPASGCANGYQLYITRKKDIVPNAPTLKVFNLLSPPNGSRLVTIENNNTPVNITWSNAKATSYKWMAKLPVASFSNPLLVFNANNSGADTALTLTDGAINNLLDGLGILRGDSVTLEWSVFAYLNQDSLKAQQTFTITLIRNRNLKSFNLLSPANNARIEVKSGDNTNLNITWEGSSANATYKWLLDLPTANFTSPLANISSNNNGSANELTLTSNQVDALLAANGVTEGDSINLKWIVKAYEGTDSLLANNSFNLKLIRLKTTGLLDVFKNSVRIYPNPVHNNLFVKSDKMVSLKLFTIDGKVILVEPKAYEHNINVSELKQGVFLLQITGNEQTFVQKISVE